MDDRHVIEQAVLDIRFDSEEQAWAEQGDLSTYVKNGLMPVIGEVFSEFSQPEVRLSFDLLEIDLGIVRYDSLHDELRNRLREQLGEALARLIPAGSAGGGPRLETTGQRDFSLLRFFLERGHLPWHAGAAETGRMEETLLRLLRGKDSGFLSFLAGTTNRERLLARVVNQFSDAVLSELATTLRSFSWSLPRLGLGGTPLMEQELSPILLKEPVAAELFPAELSLRIGHAFEEGDVSWLSTAWSELCVKYPRSLLEELRRHGRSAAVRKQIAEHFPESTIKAILLFLEPDEAPFIEEVTEKPELFHRAALSGRDDDDHTRRRLWEFTLGYLLEERGSLFNRRAYMGSLVTSTAACAGLDLKELLVDMKRVLESFTVAAPLKQELFGILNGLEEEVEPQHPSAGEGRSDSTETTETRKSVVLIEEALLSGSLRELVVRWPHLLREHPLLLQKELRRLGRRETILSKMAELFSADMLRETLTLLASGESEFLEAVMEWPQLFCGALPYVQEDVAKTRKWLWEFTLGYLLEEQGTTFNRKAYLENMMRSIATHGNYDFQELLLSVHEQLRCLVLETRLQAEFLILVEEIAAEVGVNLLRAAGSRQRGLDLAESLIHELSEAFLRGTPRGLADVWLRMLQASPRLLLLELRRHGADAALRKRIAESFSDTMLKLAVALLEPGESLFIEELAAKMERFHWTSPHPRKEVAELKRRLWEYTLDFLLEERGSSFNRKSYLENLVRRMAAYDSVDVRELLCAMYEMLSTLEASAPFTAEMVELIEVLYAETGLPLSPIMEKQHQPDEGSALEQIRLRIDKALLRGTSEDQALIRTEFLRGHSLLLREELRKLGRWGAVRRRIAELFSEEMLRELMTLLEPDGIGFIEQILGSQELFGRTGILAKEDMGTGPEGDSLFSTLKGERIDRRLWEFTLDYLLEEGGGRFNKKTYLAGLIQRVAANDNLDGLCLLKELRSVLAGDEAAGAFHGDLLALIDELLGETMKGVEKTEPVNSKGSPHTANPLVQRLHRVLTSGDGAMSARPGELKRMQDDLVEHNPEQLAQLFRELASGGTFGLATGSFYVAEDLRRMIELFLQLVSAVEPEKLANFLRTLDQWSVRCEDARRFLGQVFELLMQNRPVDCETIAIGAGLMKSVDGAGAMPQHRSSAAGMLDSSLAWKFDDASDDLSGGIYVANAGLVLAAPFLPQLFGMLGLIEKMVFVDPAAAERGAHVLQYLANKGTETVEPLLVLNKIMCGIMPEMPLARRVGIEAREIECVESLIKGMIDNWSILGATSTDGFRESFFQREGVLRMKENEWHLLVEPRAHDLLLDHIPWSFSVTKHPWMLQAVHVEWRHGL